MLLKIIKESIIPIIIIKQILKNHSQILNMLDTPLSRSWQSTNRLFGSQPQTAPTTHQQQILIQQLEYWRSLPKKQFNKLTCQNLNSHHKPVYQINQLPLDMLFLTFSRLYPRAAQMSLPQVQRYWLKRFRDNGYNPTHMRCCIERHKDGGYHWHVLVRFDRTYLFSKNHLRIDRKLGPKNFAQPVYNWNSAQYYLQKDGQFIDWQLDEQSQSMEKFDKDSELKSYLEAPGEVALKSSESQKILRDILSTFAYGTLDEFVKVMRALAKKFGFQGPDCFTVIEKIRFKK